ncbi:MAG: NUDIX domain-containing protein [Candidatus Aenigmarchaeota archaeon]|nr:NUDIX domain-containing protein [Candidatus Aenigmarchaeota archaeon]
MGVFMKFGVGVGVLLVRNAKILLGKRSSDPSKTVLHGENTWTLPGGKIKYGECLVDACFREVLEETGMRINKENLRRISIKEEILSDAHFITFGYICDDFEGEAKVMEPDEIEEWRWFKIDELPKNLYLPSKKIIEAYKSSFFHPALNQNKETKIAFIGLSKHYFYFRRHIVKFVLEQGYTPISQYGIFDYFLLDTVERDKIRNANNNLLMRSDELWIFGPISDGVLAEIKLAKQLGKPIRYFTIIDSKEIKEISKEEVELEEKALEKFRSEL